MQNLANGQADQVTAPTLNLADAIKSESWRIRNLYMIEDMETGQIVPFVLRPEQEIFLRENHQRNFILKCRKLGFSTEELIRALDKCLFNVDPSGTNGNFLAALIDKGLSDAKKKLNIVKTAWLQGPRHPNPQIAQLWRDIHDSVRMDTQNKEELGWTNGSMIQVGTSFRGGTPRQVHISEFGTVAANSVKKAEEIITGALNALPQSGRITIETTHEGGKWGKCYAMARLAMASKHKTELAPIEWKFFFFPWMEHPSYLVEQDQDLDDDTAAYFNRLEKEQNIYVSRQRKNWYSLKRKEQGFGMLREFPSTEDEAFMTQIEGAIYPELLQLRARGRIRDIAPEQGEPLHFFCDIGISDFMAVWAGQIMPMAKAFIDHFEREGINAYTLAAQVKKWDDQFCCDPASPVPIGKVFLPHDANKRAPGDAKTFRDHLQAGLTAEYAGAIKAAPQIVVVPRTSDIWNGIGAVRRLLLPNAYFHTRCDQGRKVGDVDLPSGVGCLEGYKKEKPGASGTLKEEPAHDLCSHTADAFRTCAEALERGLIQNASNAATISAAIQVQQKTDGFNRPSAGFGRDRVGLF